MNFYHSLTPYTKVSSKGIKDFKCETGHYKTPREKHRQNILWHKSQQYLFWLLSQNNGNKSKNKWDPPKLKDFCTTKETINKTKRQLEDFEKIFANDVTDNGSVSKIYKELVMFNRIKTNNPIPKQTDLNRHFFKEDIQMAKKHMKRCSTVLIIREMQIKNTMRYHLMPTRMTIIKKSTNDKCWRGCGEKGTFRHCWWECTSVWLLWKTVWRFLKKTKNRTPYDPAIPLLGLYPEKNMIWKDICTLMFIALFTITRTWKQPKCPLTEEWLSPISIKLKSCPKIVKISLYQLGLYQFTESIFWKYTILLKYKMKSSLWKIYSTVSSSSGICVEGHIGFSAMSDWRSWKRRNKNLKKTKRLHSYNIIYINKRIQYRHYPRFWLSVHTIDLF